MLKTVFSYIIEQITVIPLHSNLSIVTHKRPNTLLSLDVSPPAGLPEMVQVDSSSIVLTPIICHFTAEY